MSFIVKMIKAEEQIIGDLYGTHHHQQHQHHSLPPPIVITHQPYETTSSETGLHVSPQMDEKPIFTDYHDPCDLKQENFVIRYPQELYVQRNSVPTNVVKMQPMSPSDKYQSFGYQPLCMPTSTSLPLNSATSTIKYCGSANSNTIIDVNTRKMNNFSPSSSTVPQMGTPPPMNRQMKNEMSITSYNSATPSDTLTITKSTSHSPNDPPSAPDTTKKSTGGRRAEKPPMSYINMIANAIKGSPNNRCTLNEIYEYLKKR